MKSEEQLHKILLGLLHCFCAIKYISFFANKCIIWTLYPYVLKLFSAQTLSPHSTEQNNVFSSSDRWLVETRTQLKYTKMNTVCKTVYINVYFWGALAWVNKLWRTDSELLS